MTLPKLQTKIQIIDKILKIDDKDYQYVGKFLHSLLEKFKEEFDHIIIVTWLKIPPGS